jgi:hypothetical protein
MTSANHLNRIAISITKPTRNVGRPQPASFSQPAAPIMAMNSDTDANTGQRLPWGTK